MKKLTALVLALMMLLSMAACAAKEPSTDSDLDYVTKKGTLVVGITDFAPMDYQDASGS